MKCMSVPANLTWKEWDDLVKRQLNYLGAIAAYDEIVLHQLFRDGVTVNDAVSMAIEANSDEE